MNFIIGQVLGVIVTILSFISYQFNNKKKLLFIQTVAIGVGCASYFFLSASSGLVLNFVCMARNITFYFQKEGTKVNRLSALLFSITIIILGIISWQAWFSILLMISLVVNTIAISLGKPQLLRQSILFSASLSIGYNCFVHSFGGVANELLTIISSIIGIIRHNKDKNK